MTEQADQLVDGFGHEVPRPARPFLNLISESLAAGLSQAEIQAKIKERKIELAQKATGIRDDFLRQSIRYLRGEANINPPPQFRFIEKTKSPDPFRSREATGITTRRFSYRVGIFEVDEDGKSVLEKNDQGELVPKRSGVVGISSSVRLSRQRILDEATKMVDLGLEQYTEEIPAQFRLDIIDAMISNDFLLSGGDNFT